MNDLQILINKWKLEADELKSQYGKMCHFDRMPISSERRRLLKCIKEAESLLAEKANLSHIIVIMLNEASQAEQSEQMPVDFMVWYSGMDKYRVLASYEKYKVEKSTGTY